MIPVSEYKLYIAKSLLDPCTTRIWIEHQCGRSETSSVSEYDLMLNRYAAADRAEMLINLGCICKVKVHQDQDPGDEQG